MTTKTFDITWKTYTCIWANNDYVELI